MSALPRGATVRRDAGLYGYERALRREGMELIAGVDLGGLPVRRVGVRVEGLTAVDGTVRRPMLDEAVGEHSRVSEWSNASPARLARVSVDL